MHCVGDGIPQSACGCQLPLTREPALSVSCADSSPTGGAKERGTDCHVRAAPFLAMTGYRGPVIPRSAATWGSVSADDEGGNKCQR
nr:MAG TPA: hypothetical protein [Caudoviricetes sp.]